MDLHGLNAILCHGALADFGGALKEQVGTCTGLWERDDVSDGLCLAENGHQAVEAYRQPDRSMSEMTSCIRRLPKAKPPWGGAPQRKACNK